MKALIAFTFSLGLLQAASASAVINEDFNDPILEATGGLAGPSLIGAWYANSPSPSSQRSWYGETNLIGSDEDIEPIARFQDLSTGVNSTSDTRGLLQIIPNTSGLTGVQTLTFSYLINDRDVANGNPHNLKLRVEVFGINSTWTSGSFDLAEPNTTGDLSTADTIPKTAYTVLLNSNAFTKTKDASLSNTTWREATFNVDFGTGYNRLGLRFTASNGALVTAGTTTDIAVDKVSLGSNQPTAVPDSFTVRPGSTNNSCAVLANDSGQPLALASVTTPSSGSAVISNNVILYTPNAGFTGRDSFSYTLAGSSSSALVEINVETTTKHFQVLVNSSANLLDALRGLPGNLALTSISQPTKGVTSVLGNRVSYTPAPDATGTDSFNCTTSDGDTFRVNIDIRTSPNFVLILADDQGWTTLEGQSDKNRPESKSDYHITPNLTRLATSGMRFSRGYSAAPNCSPSRYALQTGKTCARLGFTDIVGRNVTPEPDTTHLMISPGKKVDAIQSSDITLPELLKTLPAPYATAHWGKWHLAGGGPASHGYDESDGATGNAAGDAGSTQNADPKLVYSVTARAIDFMSRKSTAGTPFYCQISHYATHLSIRYSAASYAAYQGRTPGVHQSNRGWAAMHTDLDAGVGRTLDALEDLGISHSTYIIYQADNGALSAYSDNTPLRGGKPEIWEGGIRVPTMISGPGIEADSQCDLNVMGIDMLPTLWEWAGGNPANLPAGIDGGSLLSAIRAISQHRAASEISRPGAFVHYAPQYVLADGKDQRPTVAIHDGDYKLVIEFEKPTFDSSFSLYHLGNRIGEDQDLSEKEIAVRWRLWVRLRDYLKEVKALYAVPDPDNWPGSDGINDGDADNDGIQDLTEMREMLTVAFDGRADTDHDGVSDADEIAAGTDPLLPSAIRVDSFTRTDAEHVTLHWTFAPGRFQIESSEDLQTWTDAGTVETNDFNGTAAIAVTSPKCFFRIRRF